MVLKALIFHISFQDANDIFLKVAQRQTNCQCQWWTEGVECDSIIDIIVSIMWQLSQMSHHQTSAFLVTPVFIIEPMIIIMLISNQMSIPSLRIMKRGKQGTKKIRMLVTHSMASYHLHISPVERASIVPRVIFKTKSDLQPMFL